MPSEYEFELLNYIADLQVRIDGLEEENSRLHRENQSYKMWMDRSIERVKAMQK